MIGFDNNQRSNKWFYNILIGDKYPLSRDELLIKLNEDGIQTRPIWGLIHKQKPYANFFAYNIEKAQYYYDRVLSIPCSSNITKEQIETVVERLEHYAK